MQAQQTQPLPILGRVEFNTTPRRARVIAFKGQSQSRAERKLNQAYLAGNLDETLDAVLAYATQKWDEEVAALVAEKVWLKIEMFDPSKSRHFSHFINVIGKNAKLDLIRQGCAQKRTNELQVNPETLEFMGQSERGRKTPISDGKPGRGAIRAEDHSVIRMLAMSEFIGSALTQKQRKAIERYLTHGKSEPAKDVVDGAVAKAQIWCSAPRIKTARKWGLTSSSQGWGLTHTVRVATAEEWARWQANTLTLTFTLEEEETK